MGVEVDRERLKEIAVIIYLANILRTCVFEVEDDSAGKGAGC